MGIAYVLNTGFAEETFQLFQSDGLQGWALQGSSRWNSRSSTRADSRGIRWRWGLLRKVGSGLSDEPRPGILGVGLPGPLQVYSNTVPAEILSPRPDGISPGRAAGMVTHTVPLTTTTAFTNGWKFFQLPNDCTWKTPKNLSSMFYDCIFVTFGLSFGHRKKNQSTILHWNMQKCGRNLEKRWKWNSTLIKNVKNILNKTSVFLTNSARIQIKKITKLNNPIDLYSWLCRCSCLCHK